MTKETSTPSRLPDPWADTFAHTERLRLERAKEERLAKKERREWIGSGLTYAFTGILIAGVILAAIYFTWRAIDSHANARAVEQQQKTERMQLCLSHEDIAERQLCVFGLDEGGE